MHPLIARFLDAKAVIAVLEKADQAPTLNSDEAAVVTAAARFPESRDAVLKAKGKSKPTNDAQQHLVRLATEAALVQLRMDGFLGPKVTAAKAALKAEGATDDEAHHLVMLAVLDEAFGWAEDPTEFDSDFLGETLDGLTVLAKVTAEVVEDFVDAFSRAGGERALRTTVAEALVEAAWSEGPEPVTPEHVDACLETLAQSTSRGDFVKAVEALAAVLDDFKKRQWVGPQRHTRLMQVLRTAVASGELEEEDDDEEDDEGGAQA